MKIHTNRYQVTVMVHCSECDWNAEYILPMGSNTIKGAGDYAVSWCLNMVWHTGCQDKVVWDKIKSENE